MTAPITDRPHRSRLTERDADYTRLRDATQRRLTASLTRLVRELRASPTADRSRVLSAFIQRQTSILQDAYMASYREGSKDYFGETSATPDYWAQRMAVNPDRMRAALSFYAPSIAKMAHEALQAVSASPGVKLEELIEAAQDEAIKLWGFGGFRAGGGPRGPHGINDAFESLHPRGPHGMWRNKGQIKGKTSQYHVPSRQRLLEGAARRRAEGANREAHQQAHHSGQQQEHTERVTRAQTPRDHERLETLFSQHNLSSAEGHLWSIAGGGHAGELEYAVRGAAIFARFNGPTHRMEFTLTHNMRYQLVMRDVSLVPHGHAATHGALLIRALAGFSQHGVVEVHALSSHAPGAHHPLTRIGATWQKRGNVYEATLNLRKGSVTSQRLEQLLARMKADGHDATPLSESNSEGAARGILRLHD